MFAEVLYCEALAREPPVASIVEEPVFLTGQRNAGFVAQRCSLLRFALSSFMLLIMSLCQGLFRWLVWDRFVEDRVWQFVDLLAVTNISCFLMEERFYGHYLHGRSVHAHADSDMGATVDDSFDIRNATDKTNAPAAGCDGRPVH